MKSQSTLPDGFTYWAFISYSHRDESFCEWLHHGLDSYKTPQPLVGLTARDGDYVIPKKLYPIFRDREELAAGSSLSDAITTALQNSRYLVVICSPHSAQSYWVNEEVRHFIALGREKYILPIILGGEPNAKEGQEECFPQALRLPKEPIAADAREGKDGRYSALMKLRAGLLGVRLEDLVNRELQRQRKQARRNGLIALLMLLLTVLAWQKEQEAISQQREAIIQRKESEHNYGLVLAEKADRAFLDKQVNEGQVYAAHALARIDLARGGEVEAVRASVLEARLGQPRIPMTVVEGQSSGVIRSVAFSPDGNTLATAGSDDTVRLWDAASKKPLTPFNAFTHDGDVLRAIFSPNGKIIASGGADKTIRLWHTANGETIAQLDHGSEVKSMAFSPDGKTLASAGDDKNVRLWDIPSGKQRMVFQGHRNPVMGVAFTPDGKTLVSGGWGGTLRLWDIASGKQQSILEGSKHSINGIALSPDGKILASAGGDKMVRLWDMASGKMRAQLEGHENPWVWSVTFSPDGTMLASGGLDATVRLWNVATGKPLARLVHTGGVTSVAFAPDGKTVVSVGRDATVRYWDIRYSQLQTTTEWNADTIPIPQEVFSPNGKIRALGHMNKTISLWNVANNKSLAELTGHEDGVWSLAFSPNGRWLASGSSDKTVRIWDVITRQSLIRLAHGDWVKDVAFSADGGTLISDDGTVQRHWVLDDLSVRDWRAQAVQDEKRYGFKLQGLKLVPCGNRCGSP